LLSKLDGIGFNPILPRFGPKDNAGAVELTDCMMLWDTEYQRINLIIRDALQERHVEVSDNMGYLACSLIAKHNGIIVDPEGIIYKCPTMVGYHEYAVGSVKEADYNQMYDTFVSLQAWKRCKDDCKYLPTCSGGCRFMAFVEHGNFEDIWCIEKSIDDIAPSLIQLDYETQRAKARVGK